MIQHSPANLAALYDVDETAWLDAMAEIAAQRRAEDVDWEHLAEYLADMSRRDRRAVRGKLTGLLAHLLKWDHQKENRSNSWRRSIVVQRRDLRDLLTSRTLRKHAEAILAEAYQDAIEQAAAETGMHEDDFPALTPYTLEEALESKLEEQ
jgi:hypothetical protein